MNYEKKHMNYEKQNKFSYYWFFKKATYVHDKKNLISYLFLL